MATAAIAPVVAFDLLTSGFAARLQGGPSVDAWEEKLARYGTDYMSTGAADIQRRVAAELGSVFKGILPRAGTMRV
jgi:hypothetical protein